MGATDDPVLTREVWTDLLSEFLKEERKRDPERFNQFDSDWLQKNDRELLRHVEAKQAEIANLGDAQASFVWRLIIELLGLFIWVGLKKHGALAVVIDKNDGYAIAFKCRNPVLGEIWITTQEGITPFDGCPIFSQEEVESVFEKGDQAIRELWESKFH